MLESYDGIITFLIKVQGTSVEQPGQDSLHVLPIAGIVVHFHLEVRSSAESPTKFSKLALSVGSTRTAAITPVATEYAEE